MPPASAKSKTESSPRRVFISYARQDGVTLAHQLRDFLAQSNFEPWLDTQQIGGGASWIRNIEDAIDNSHALIAILTEGSYVSEICRAEQMRALRTGKTVIPVLAKSTAPRPLFLETLNYRLFPAQQHDLVKDLGAKPKQPVLPQLRYDTVPSPPQNFMPRENAVAAIRHLLFSSEGSSESIAVTAVAGMGGIGKTVLTIALCRDPTVRNAFPDGIAWITIGREWDGDFVPRMREVAKALGDDLAAYDNPIACQTQYRNLLRSKAALVVIDDVWNIQHLDQLLVDAPRSRFLFTTRDKTIVRAKTNRSYSADVLTATEARALLALWSNLAPENLPPAESAAIIEACGGLALALAQIGGSLRGLPAYEWRYTVDHLKNANISALQNQLPSGQDNFFKSLSVSLDAIRDEILCRRYRTLAVLLEDVPAPLTILQTLWAASEPEAHQTARYFVDRSLATWQSDADPAQGIKLHDLQLDYVRACYPNQQSLRLIHEATRLSSHVLANHPEQYVSQLTARLCGLKSNPEISQFVSQISAAAPKPWLQSIHPALHPPGTALVRTLEGHSDRVYGVAVTSDGRRAVSASRDETLKVWDLETGRVLHTLAGHSASVNGVAVTGDGRRAVSASSDNTLKVWDLESGRVLHTLEGHSDSVTGVAVTGDGRRAVSASGDKTLKVWDLESGRVVHTLEGHSAPVLGVAVTLDGRRAVSASYDRTLKVWDLESGGALYTLEGHSDWVNGVAVTLDGRRAVSASYDRTLKVWDLESGRALHTVEGHTSPVNGVAVTRDGRRAVSASRDNTLKVWDLESGRALQTLAGHSAYVSGVAATADGQRAISASGDNTLKVWDLRGDRAQQTLAGHSASVTGVAATEDGRRAVSASHDKTLKAWDLESGRALHTLEGHSDLVNGVAVTLDGRRAVSASNDKTLKVWDLESGHALHTLEGHSASVYAVAVTLDGRRAVSASWDKTLKVWDLESGCMLRTLEGHSNWVSGVAVTQDGRRAVSASWDKTLKVWDLDSGRALHTLEGHSGPVNGVAVTSDGRRAVSASSDQTLKAWDLERGRALHTLAGHSDDVSGVAVTSDGRRAVSASWDKTLKVWDLETGRCIATFTCDGSARCCAIADTLLVAGDLAGRVYFLRLIE